MRSFTIATSHAKRWWRVTIHPDVQQLRDTLRERGINHANPWGYDRPTLWAYTQPASYVRGPSGCLYPDDGFAGDLFFAEPYVTPEIVAHELVHAAVATLRMTDTRCADLGDDFSHLEEELATIYGQLYADMDAKLREAS